nr:hypothetical protein CKG001_10510 [Bdellovibrio sp. CKG001]
MGMKVKGKGYYILKAGEQSLSIDAYGNTTDLAIGAFDHGERLKTPEERLETIRHVRNFLNQEYVRVRKALDAKASHPKVGI